MAHILIAGDEPAVSELIARNLALVGHDCLRVDSGTAALAALRDGGVDLALLDAMLPGMDGLSVLSARPDKTVPVLLLTARSNLADRARCLELGADDYIIKPFEIAELVARVTAALRRAHRGESRFCIDGLAVDMSAREACYEGAPVELTPQEYSLLEALIVNRNLALSREKLLSLAWGFEHAGESRTVDVHIQRLRKKLGLEKRIKTVYKLGYRFDTLT